MSLTEPNLTLLPIPLESFMTAITSDADVDALVWSTLQGSPCAQDYLDFIRHASGRPAPYEQAFLLACAETAGSIHFYCVRMNLGNNTTASPLACGKQMAWSNETRVCLEKPPFFAGAPLKPNAGAERGV